MQKNSAAVAAPTLSVSALGQEGTVSLVQCVGNAVATELFAIAWTARSSINNVPCYIKGSDGFDTSISTVAVTDAPGKN